MFYCESLMCVFNDLDAILAALEWRDCCGEGFQCALAVRSFLKLRQYECLTARGRA